MFNAIVKFFGQASGGPLVNPPGSGSHPLIKINDEFASCTVVSLTGEALFALDIEHEVRVTLVNPTAYTKTFAKGEQIQFYSGPNLVGMGIVISDK